MRLPEVVIRIDRKASILIAALVLIGTSAGVLWSETLTIATTYPAPSGIYNFLVTTGNAAATAADTVLNRNAGNTILVPATNAGGKVGIGMTPVNKLDVAGNASFTGSVQLGNDTAACVAGNEGSLRRTAQTDIQLCKAGAWEAFGAGAPGKGTMVAGCGLAGGGGSMSPGCPKSCPRPTCTPLSTVASCTSFNRCVGTSRTGDCAPGCTLTCSPGWVVWGNVCIKS